MSVNVLELYQQTVLPLPEPARLQLLALIADDLAFNGATAKRAEDGQASKPLPTEEETRAAEARFAHWLGSVNSGNPRSADNEQIDADLARESANERAPLQRMSLDTRERRAALDELMRFAGAVSSGNPRAADNEAIDADLAREYGNEI